MDASKLVLAVRRLGVAIKAEGDRVLVRPAASLPDELRAELRIHRIELVRFLTTVANSGDLDWGPEQFFYKPDAWPTGLPIDVIETLEERAAIAEYDGGLTRVEAERLAIESLRTNIQSGELERAYQPATAEARGERNPELADSPVLAPLEAQRSASIPDSDKQLRHAHLGPQERRHEDR